MQRPISKACERHANNAASTVQELTVVMEHEAQWRRAVREVAAAAVLGHGGVRAVHLAPATLTIAGPYPKDAFDSGSDDEDRGPFGATSSVQWPHDVRQLIDASAAPPFAVDTMSLAFYTAIAAGGVPPRACVSCMFMACALDASDMVRRACFVGTAALQPLTICRHCQSGTLAEMGAQGLPALRTERSQSSRAMKPTPVGVMLKQVCHARAANRMRLNGPREVRSTTTRMHLWSDATPGNARHTSVHQCIRHTHPPM